MDEERKLSEWLFQLTQELIASQDFTDANINRICARYYEQSDFPDRDRLLRLIAQLKRKLRLNSISIARSPPTADVVEPSPNPPIPGKPSQSANHVVAGIVDGICENCGGAILLRGEDSRTSTFSGLPEENYTLSDFGTDNTGSTSCSCASRLARLPSVETVLTSCLKSSQTPYAQSESDVKRVTYSGVSEPDPEEADSCLLRNVLLGRTPDMLGTSSEALMRLAAGDRIFCCHCQEKPALHFCRTFKGCHAEGCSKICECNKTKNCEQKPSAEN
ncbi:uncharacterized protein LOC129749998 [Uranotaenia lowii]|uniref:uncharacterized protein LOC129749998 n=1 Tax=Uranotaenia lowii TaxID=190385 RepID=UPI00247A1775|nr:uncharacterized protein LOC129749998 [Uranotaenia lowii]